MTSPLRKAPGTDDEVRVLRAVGPDTAAVNVTHLPQHLAWMRRAGRAERTIQCRRREIERLARTLGHDPATATLVELEAWQESLPSLNYMRWATAIIRPYFKYLRDRGLRSDDPAALLPLPPTPQRLPRPISEDALLKAIRNAPPRILPWLLLAGWSGLRAIEIAGLQRESFSVDADGQVWASVIGKGDKHRYVPVPAWAWARIEPDLPESGPCWGLITGSRRGEQLTARHVSQYCCNYLHRQGITDNLHSLRHRVATLTLEQTGNLRLVQDLLGHANLRQLSVYTKVRSSAVAGAVSGLPGIGSTAPDCERQVRGDGERS